MTILIDAWLERRDPTLRVWDRDRHEVLVEWRGANLRDLLEQGLLELDNLGESVWLLLRHSAPGKNLLAYGNGSYLHESGEEIGNVACA